MPAILFAADYLAKKIGQAEERVGAIGAITTELVDERGHKWRLSLEKVSDEPATEADSANP